MKVYVATYSHKHGDDIRVFKSKKTAEDWRIKLADEYWRDFFGEDYEKPNDKEKMADIYFDTLRDSDCEFFGVEECDVE